MTRAAGASVVRSSAHRIGTEHERGHLAEAVHEIADELSNLEVDGDLIAALRARSKAIAQGRLPLIDETPHPYVCRACGHLELAEPEGNCPRCDARGRTFQWFPPVHWLEAMDPLEVMEWLTSKPEQVRILIEVVDEEQLSREVLEGEWSVRDLLAHLRDAQGVLDFWITLPSEEDNPEIESKAVFEWATEAGDRPSTWMQVLNTYHESRRSTLEALEGIPLGAWWREGRHQEFCVVSIKQQASYFATHDLTHLPRIELLLGQPEETQDGERPPPPWSLRLGCSLKRCFD